MKASARIKEKRIKRFSSHDLFKQIRTMRNLQRARSAKFPAQLATSAKREVPRATCNERKARSSPRRICKCRDYDISIDVRFYRVRRRNNAKRSPE